MCNICNGNPPNPLSFNKFQKEAKIAAGSFHDFSGFAKQAAEVDNLRFNSGDEWGEPNIYQSVKKLIFANPDPDEGLLLFTFGCWLDMQAPYIVVWNNYLKQAKLWKDEKGPLPRGGFKPTSTHLLLTKNTLQEYGHIGQWFTDKIIEIVEKNSNEGGNIYRLAGEMCNDLYAKSEPINYLRSGRLPNQFSGGDHKRFWMFLMFLRRDNSVVKCLFSRALGQALNGEKAVAYWYNDSYFNPLECELPVDVWVSHNWNKVCENLNAIHMKTDKPPQVAAKARAFASKLNISPSTLDALLFYS